VKIPTTVVTGFLGAGKTTLIRHLLQNAKGHRLALIVNEFGDVGVDGELLKGCNDAACPEEDIVELANGCICCTVADDFLPTMLKLLDRPNPPEHIIIETSGLALPRPLIKAFQWPDIRTRATIDGVITLITPMRSPRGGSRRMRRRWRRRARRIRRSTMTARSRNCSTTSSPAPTWSCSTRRTWSARSC
jgi:G3E family GTPase